jgi:choline dehydrogenase
VLAARLSEDPDHKVILVEAGPSYLDIENDQLPEDIRDAGEMSVERHDWGLQGYFIEPAEDRELQPYPRGRVVGGSSSVNAAIGQRGTPDDFAAWAAIGNEEWEWDKVLPYFNRLENDLDFGDRPYHGASGPVPITRYPESDWAPAVQACARAWREQGFPDCADFNDPTATGVGPTPRNLVGEVRASSMVTYLKQARERPNLTIISDTMCRCVVFDGVVAVGVEVERDGETEVIRTDRVVLSAGAIHTPHILMLSGIGPAAPLTEVGIEPLVVNEAVGQNLQDHPMIPVVTLLREQTDRLGARSALRFTSEIGNELGLVDDMSVFPCVMEPSTLNLDVDTKGRKALTFISNVSKPRSIGWMTITSADPHVQPELHFNYVSAPEDMARAMASVRMVRDMCQRLPLKDEITEIVMPDTETVADDARFQEWIRTVVTTAYHPVGTCRMGPAADPGAVVDQHLAVHGVEHLWVADASVMVNVPTAFTNLTAFMIGERLADWMKSEAPQTASASSGQIAGER